MKINVVDLNLLYQTLLDIYNHPASPPELPKRGTDLFSQYTQAYERLISPISLNRSIYLWFNLYKPEYIYIGISYKDRDGLRGRLRNEFKQWYHILWMNAFESDKYVEEVIKLYPRKKPSKTGATDYRIDVLNATDKAGATHIIYTDNYEGADITVVEKDLIQLFNNPRGNNRDKRKSPLPENQLTQSAKIIHTEFINKITTLRQSNINK